MRLSSIPSFTPRQRATVAMVGASFCWANGSVMTASLVSGVAPITLLFIQLLGSNIFLWSLLLYQRVAIPRSRQMALVGSMGIIEPGLTYLCSIVGLQRLSVSASSLIFATEPFMVAVLAWFILRERLTREVALGCVISLAGISLTLADGMQAELVGAALVIASTSCAAVYVVCNQRISKVSSPLARAACQQLCGLLVIGLLLAAVEGFQGIYHIPHSTVWTILISGVIQYAIAFWLYLIAVDRLPVTTATLFLSLIPVFTVLEGGFFLGEHLTTLQWLGALLVLASLRISCAVQHGKT